MSLIMIPILLTMIIMLMALGVTVYRHPRRLWLLLLALVLAFSTGGSRGWDEMSFYLLWTGALFAVGAIAAWVHSLVRHDQPEGWERWLIAGLTTLLVALLTMLPDALGVSPVFRERGAWLWLWLPMLIPAFPLAVLFYFTGRRVWVYLQATGGGEAVGAAPASGDRRLIMQMLRDGKITAPEAQELLSALPPEPTTPADRVPPTAGVLAAVVGAIAVAAGFVLPWAFVRMPMPGLLLGQGGRQITGHQAGYHLGMLGWLVLALGLLPAILACISGLDRVVRQAMLRGVLAATGIALTASLCLKSPANIGIWVCLTGFVLQFATALPQGLSAAAAPDGGDMAGGG